MAGAGAAMGLVGGESRTSTICFFSKHLPTLSWSDLAVEVKKAGFDGIDLTVRPGGHVLPERVTEDLPRAAAAIRAAGLELPMITTGLTSAEDPAAGPTVAGAGRLQIPFFKTGYYKYKFVDPRIEAERAVGEFGGLAGLGVRHGVVAGFHNHEGNIGGPISDVATEMERLGQRLGREGERFFGYYFDVRHAVCEGAGGGWKTAFHLASRRLKMIAVKDFYWERTVGKDGTRSWKQVNCPLGEGMVDWRLYCKMLRQAGFAGPISLHIEYPIPGRSEAEVIGQTLIAARRDLAFLRERLREA